MKLIDGKLLASKIRYKIKNSLIGEKTKPGLAIILVGDNKASRLYVSIKEKEAHGLSFYFEKYIFPGNTKEYKVSKLIQSLNQKPNIHGIVIQLPLPKKFNTDRLVATIDPLKDVDGFHPENVKKLLQLKKWTSKSKDAIIVPALIYGIIEMIQSLRLNLKNKQAVIVSNTKTFSEPLKHILILKGLSVKVWIRGKQSIEVLKNITKKADLLITAAGSSNFITQDMIKTNSVVIDVGMNRVGKTVKGDVDFDVVSKIVHAITPVPGGVGPMTVACLLRNTFVAMLKIEKIK